MQVSCVACVAMCCYLGRIYRRMCCYVLLCAAVSCLVLPCLDASFLAVSCRPVPCVVAVLPCLAVSQRLSSQAVILQVSGIPIGKLITRAFPVGGALVDVRMIFSATVTAHGACLQFIWYTFGTSSGHGWAMSCRRTWWNIDDK